jgi:4-amino-4-deoxy-L-arabinose transferase-like glycosyltransferase
MFYKVLLLIILLITRFWGLGWGGGFRFHPDENNMAWAVERLSWHNFDPDFFAYGQFPIYLSFISRQVVNFIFNQSFIDQIRFSTAVNYLRFWSAFFSVLTVIIGYLLGKIIFKKQKYAKITALLLIFTPGLIQMAHFGTTESLLTFVGLASAYLAIKYYQTKKIKFVILSGLVGAIGMASKLNAILFLLGPFLAIILRPKRFRRLFFWGLFVILLTIIFSPYYLIRFENFWGTFIYESNVARGISSVFYTRQFINTKPFIFQFKKIFPWVLGLPMFSFLLISLTLVILNLFQNLFKKKFKLLPAATYLLLATSVPWFIFNSFLFAKWTRFITPVLPFLIIFAVYSLKKLQLLITDYLLLITLLLLIFPGIFFTKIYFQKDIRVRACQWMNKNLPEGSTIIYEGGNIVDLPKLDHQKFKTVNIDFYHFDENLKQQKKLSAAINEAGYFFSPSRRIFTNHTRLPEKFPKTAEFYHQLYSGQLGYKKIKEFHPFGPVGRFLLGSDLNSEETWTVFDHPTLRLWRR